MVDRRTLLKGSGASWLLAPAQRRDSESGRPITGIDAAEKIPGVSVYHAGTAARDGDLLTAGGRVLTVVAGGASYGEAIDRAYRAVGKIRFDGMQYRRDIGYRAIARDR